MMRFHFIVFLFVALFSHLDKVTLKVVSFIPGMIGMGS